ncbi:MAG: STT3 domain-containing protein [Candidatus Woesearchaeota archaeon]
MSKNDEISIDLESIKKSTKKTYNNTKNFFKNNTALITTILLILLMISAYNVRAQTYELGYLDDVAENFISNQIKQGLAEQIRQQNPALSSNIINSRVEAQYREYYRQNRAQIDFDIRQLGDQLRQNFIGPSGEPYILDIDTHYYWQLTRQYLETGYVFDTVLEDGTFMDSYQLAPLGAIRPQPELHPVYSGWIYKITSPITGWSAYKTFNLTSAIIAMLVVIPAFFIGRMFGGNITGSIAGFIMAMHPAYVSRSTAGYVSTDGYVVFFPLMILWLVLLAFRSDNIYKKIGYGSLAGFFVGLFSRSWSAWWFVFVLVMAAMIGYIAFLILQKIIRNESRDWSDFKKPGILSGVVIISGIIFTTIFSGLQAVISAPLTIFGRGGVGLGIQDAIGQGLWPNVLTTVAELSRPSTMQIVNNLGGPVIFIVAMMGIILSLLPLKNWKKYEYLIFYGGLFFAFLATTTLPMDLAINQGIDYSITFTALITLPILLGFVNLLFRKYDVDLLFAVFVSVLFIATIFTATQGVRFVLLIVPALALALAISFARAIEFIKNMFDKRDWSMDIGYVAIIIIALVLFMPIATAGHNTGYQRTPGISDAWYDSLAEIKETTPQDTILTSWWDFGHWFKALADRRVTFDGATQSTPMAHWVGKALITNDYEESVGILRMLACGSRTGFDELAVRRTAKSSVNDITAREFLDTYNQISEAVLMDRTQAISYYESVGLSRDDALSVADLTHCDAPPVIFITSNDMVGKAPVWGHFGAWDFEKAYVARVARSTRDVSTAVNEIAQTLDVDVERAQSLYFEARQLRGEREVSEWISPRPSFLTNSPISCVDEASRIICQTNIGVGSSGGAVNVISGIQINKTNPEESRFIVTVIEQATNEIITRTTANPQGIIYGGERYPIENPSIGLDVIVEVVDGTPRAIIASENLADSIFTRLYFWGESEGFEKFSEHSNSFTGHRIKNWNVTWLKD